MGKKRNEPLMDRLAAKVAGGSTVRAAARSLAVPVGTAERWAALPEFKAKVVRLREQIQNRAVNILARLACKAALTLGKLLDSADEDTRLKASRAVLSDLVTVRTNLELATELASLEERMAKGRG